ncbi:MAG: hypothetical protein ACMXYC_01690 [Candidatus Woesearchaeota archaeon]
MWRLIFLCILIGGCSTNLYDRSISFIEYSYDEQTGGFHKYYDPKTKKFQDEVVTGYTGSLLYTLSFINRTYPKSLDFLVLMQKNDGELQGAISYSLNTSTQQKSNRYVIGSAAKAIVSWVPHEPYIDNAIMAGDWLVFMQRDDGWVRASARITNNNILYSDSISLLYNGQVIKALSHLYLATNISIYKDSAQKIVNNMIDRVNSEGCLLGDDFRDPNPISSAWVLMALREFSVINESVKSHIHNCASELIRLREFTTKEYERFPGAFSTSGNGWLAEVFILMYKDCLVYQFDDCTLYIDEVQNLLEWIAKHEVVPQKGEIVWSTSQLYVRTDILAHTANALYYWEKLGYQQFS